MSENNPSLARLLTTSAGVAALEKMAGREVLTRPFEILSVAVVEGGRVASVEPKSLRQIE
jgi:hypothetical protein